MDFPSFNHHHNNNRYVPHHPPNFSNDRSYYHHQDRHHLPPPPPPPLPSYPPPLRSAPPPPPAHNSHQTQFTFLNHHHHQIEENSRNPHVFSPHSPPPSVSNRTLFEDNHRPRIHLPEFDLSDSWADPPRVSNRTPTRPVPLGFDHESSLHRRPFSPYRPPTDRYDRGFERSSSFRDEFIDGYRDNNRDQFLWGQKNIDGDNDNYRRGHDSNHYVLNSDRSRSFKFDVDSHNASKVNISRESVADFVANVGNYVSTYGSRSDNDRSWDVRDEDRKWAYDRQSSREVADATMGMENSAFDDGDEVAFVSARRLAHNYDSGKSNYRGKESREEFTCTPKKQIQKKSALLRIGKPNHRNRSRDQIICKAFFDDSNTSAFRGKDKDPLMYWDQRMEEESEGSPVEISFKSNALVAKAIMAPSSPAVVSDRNLAPRNRNIRKETLSDSPPVQFGERSVKSDNSMLVADCPSSSEKTLTQSSEKVTVSGIGSVGDIVSLPCSSGTDNSAGNSAVKESPKGKVTDLAVNTGGSNGTPSYRLRKKRKIATLTKHETSLQPTKEVGEPVDADGFTNCVSAPDQGVTHSKEEITSVGMVTVPDVVSLPSLNELTVNKLHESPLAIVSEKDDADVGRSCVPDTKRNCTTHHLSSSSPLETEIDKNTEKADRSVHDLQFVSNSDQVLTEIQNGSTVSDIGRVDDSSHHPCQNGISLLLEDGIVKGSLEGLVSVEGHSNGGLSRPEEIEISEGTVDSDASVCNVLNFDFRFIKRQENITVSGIDFVDAGPKQSSINEVTTPPENGIMEGSLNAVPTVGGYGILGLSNAEENKIHEDISNADISKYDSSTTSSSNSGHTNFQGNNIVSNSCLVDGTRKQSCLDSGSISLKNVFVNGLPKAKALEGDKSDVCSGKDHTATVNGEDVNIQLGLSSPRVSDTPVNGVSPVADVDTTFSCSVKDLVTTEEEVTVSGAGNFDVGSQPCNGGGSFLHGNRVNEGSSEVDLSVIDGVDGGPNGTSPKYKKKREVCAPPEKLVSEGGSALFSSNTCLDNSTINMKSGHVMISDLSLNTKSASFTSEDTNKTSLSLNPLRRELNLRRNQPSSALPRVPTSRPSVVFSRKTAPTNHNSKPRTWHRAVINSASPLQAKKSYSSPVLPQKLSPKKVGKFQGSAYIRKGNSLVRKPAPVTTLPHGSHASSSSVYRLNPLGIDEIKKSSGSESRVDVIDSATCLRTGGLSAPFERPRTPPLPCSTKLLNCPTTYAGDLTSSPLENHVPDDCSETTSDPLELAENVDVPKFTEDASNFSGAPEYQTGLTNNLGSQRVLDEGNMGKKILYVKRKSNQLVASSKSSDLSVQGVDKTPVLSSDGYYKRWKNQLIRTSLESHILQRVAAPDDASNSERQSVSRDISSSSSRRQFSKGFAKLYKPSKFSPVWTLSNTQSSRKYVNSLQRQMGPHLFPWKRASYSRGFMQHSASISNNSSLSLISRKLLLSRKRETIYTRSTHGFSLRISKLLSVGGSSLKWSKSIERNSKKANEEATLAVAAVEKKKREQIAASCVVAGTKRRNHFSRKSVHSIKLRPGERIYRIGSVRYKMDPSRRTLQRISDEEPSRSGSLQSEKDARKPYVPRRLLIGNDEYVRIGNGNQLIRDPKKRTRTLASEKVRWSLHTARLRLARKRKYCQFFTRFGKCNKDDGKCPYIHDPSKIAVCTKFLNGSCSNPNCKLTHKVIPERMQDCSYFLQGLCSNENCPYRHVNVNPNASICEGFLKGFCADSNECRKKHTYVCPVFKATGICAQGSKCKLHHPKSRSKGMKRKPSTEQKNAQGRYFGSRNFDIAACRTAVSENHYSKDDDDIFCQEGKFADYITLDVSDEETGETNNSTSEQRTMYDSDHSDLQVADLEELTKPIRIMKKKLKMTEIIPG